MRPRKVVLLAGADEQLLSRLFVVFESKLYRVLRAHSASAAWEILEKEPEDSIQLLLVELPLPGSEAAMKLARGVHPEIRVLARSDARMPPDSGGYDVWLPHSAGMEEMLERMKVLMARKRGPKPLRGVLDASRESKKAVQPVGGVVSERERRLA